MTTKSNSEQAEDRASQRDDEQSDPEATTEDQAANMDYEGDTPH